MKFLKRFFVLIVLSSAIIHAQTDSVQYDIKVMTFNIRYAGGESSDDPNRWSERKFLVENIFKKYQPDIIGMQEALIEQINFLDTALNVYNWVGVGRDDGFNKGEFCPIFYRKDRFELIAKCTFWLSDTPHKPSKGWDAALNRITTWMQLKDKSSNKFFYVYNTHFDHIGENARDESSKLIVKKIHEETGTDPVMLMGDFNYTSDSNGYKFLTGTNNTKEFYDAMFVSESENTGGNVTFNGFGKLEEHVGKIDFIFVTENISVLQHSVLVEKYNSRFASDHNPVLTKIRFK